MASDATVASTQSTMTLEGVTEPRETDVLCGRGGAALRHPGNQTYRRLVNLNKGLYITCLKTEKLKISRSIVAAIREQKGRFLEKDTKKGSWFDIGDKKAVEKTSQALREGQPKLRQKIVEMGGGVAGTAAFMESQYGHTGLYNPEQVGLTSVSLGGTDASSVAGSQHSMQPPPSISSQFDPDSLMSRLSLHDVGSVGGASLAGASLAGASLAGASLASMGGTSMHSLQTVDSNGMPQNSLQQRLQQLRPALSHPGQQMGVPGSQMSLMSDFSAITGNHSLASGNVGSTLDGRMGIPNESMSGMSMDSSFRKTLADLSGLPQSSGHFAAHGGLDNVSLASSMDASLHTAGTFHHPGNPQSIPVKSRVAPASSTAPSSVPVTSASAAIPSRTKMGQPIDRRNVFAKMKYTRQPSTRVQKLSGSSNHQMGGTSTHTTNTLDDQDFHMVDSSASLVSHFSNISGLESARWGPSSSKLHKEAAMSTKPTVETAKVVDHSKIRDREKEIAEVMGTGSRNSIMSGLSKMSEASFDTNNSIFSDLSRKIGNVSTRSLAMSELSAIDLQEREEEDGEPDDAKSDPSIEYL